MTNSIAITLGAFLLGGLGLDYFLFGDDHLVFLGKKFFDLLQWAAFWR
ncbi:MAG: hypothetical protein KDK26_19120 [Roseivivax sp.]|nr:hypothetical protein [Roseivivax sp.]